MRPSRCAGYLVGADAAITAAHGHLDVYLIAAPGADVASTAVPLVRDSGGEVAGAFSMSESSVYVVRPDGYLGLAAADVDANRLLTHLRDVRVGASAITRRLCCGSFAAGCSRPREVIAR